MIGRAIEAMGGDMKIAIVGYGKMGHKVRAAAESLGHCAAVTVDTIAPDADVRCTDGLSLAEAVKASGAEGVIEFSHPSAVMGNLRALVPLKLPIVAGTTGWASGEAEIAALCAKCGGVVMRSSNFSIGVNMFYRIVQEAAGILYAAGGYDAAINEIHHNQKADSPSGTALEVARRVMAAFPSKTQMSSEAFHEKPAGNVLHVSSTRCGYVPGTHTVMFDSEADTIEITHRARGREGFALGAVHSLERLAAGIAQGTLQAGRIYGMGDLF